MERDGAGRSLWQDTTEAFNAKAVQRGNTIFDVAIIGAGITGVSLALRLQLSGLSCILVEAHHAGFGTTGGTTAHINTFLDQPYTSIRKDFSHGSAASVARAVQDAVNLVRDNVRTYGIPCDWQEQDGYIHARTEEQENELANIVQYCRELGILAEHTNTTGLNMQAFRAAARFPGQSAFHPLKYVNAMLGEFQRKEGVLLQHCRMDKAEHNGISTVFTERGEIRARKLVYATHIPPGVNVLHTLNAPYRSYVIAATLDHRGEIPSGLNYDMEEPYHYYRSYMDGGEPLLIVGGEDHKTGHQEDGHAPFLALEAHARERFPLRELRYAWSSQYYQPADGLAYIGLMPGHDEDVFVATGFGGSGMVYGSMAALILHDMITTGQSPYSEVFSPARVKPLASAAEFLKENADVAKDLVKGALSRDDLETLAGLAPGEGRMVAYEDRKMGLYKDEAGNIHAVDPVCPHMKCHVNWNDLEKTWDCPCHGSRFAVNGEVLTGPATKGLEVIQPEAILNNSK